MQSNLWQSEAQVLYVDDEPDLLESIRLILEEDPNLKVDICNSPQMALQQLKTRVYDCIISDYQMPGLSGIEFLKELRKQGIPIPFIILTGRGREEVVIEALNNGATYYLQKGGPSLPMLAELRNCISQAIERRRA